MGLAVESPSSQIMEMRGFLNLSLILFVVFEVLFLFAGLVHFFLKTA